MSRLFWLSDEAWTAIGLQLPKNQPGARRVDDRRVISGIIHMLRCGVRWADCPAEYGPSTAVCNRWNRWSRRGVWARILAALTEEGWIAETAQIDSSYIKAHRCAGEGKGGAKANAIGVSRGGRTTKIHALVDALGRELSPIPTPGNTSDVKAADQLIGDTAGMKRLIADPGEHAIEMGTSEPYLDKHHVGGPSADHGPKHEPGHGHDTAQTQGGIANQITVTLCAHADERALAASILP